MGYNGDNQTYITFSSQTSLSFLDETGQSLKIKQLSTPIMVYIKRNLNTYKGLNFSPINTSNLTTRNFQSNQLLTYLQMLPGQSHSVQIQLKPEDLGNITGYLIFAKLGTAPLVNSTHSSFDHGRLFCPGDLQQDGNDTFYQLFLSMTQIQKYRGFIGFGFRQLTSSEMSLYCPGNLNQYGSNSPVWTKPPLVDPTKIVFDRKISFRMILSGCYYLDESTGNWEAEGLDVVESCTNTTQVCCTTTHLTEFAGGFLVLPEPIDFEYAFANASFEKNPFIYATVIGLSSLYVILGILCMYLDRDDRRKIGICVLPGHDVDLNSDSAYFYEIIFYTGLRKDAGTDSKVSLPLPQKKSTRMFIFFRFHQVNFMLSGSEGETRMTTLKNFNSDRKILRRGGIDSFVLPTNRQDFCTSYPKIILKID